MFHEILQFHSGLFSFLVIESYIVISLSIAITKLVVYLSTIVSIVAVSAS